MNLYRIKYFFAKHPKIYEFDVYADSFKDAVDKFWYQDYSYIISITIIKLGEQTEV